MPQVLIDVLIQFYHLAVNLLILFISISFLMNLAQAYIPFTRIEKLMSHGNGFVGIVAGAVLGFFTPFCSCSTVPLIVTLLNRKIPFQAVMTLLFTSPLVNPWVLGLMGYIYGTKVTIIYTIVTLTFSMLLGYILDKMNFEQQVKNVVVKGNIEENTLARRKNFVLNLKESTRETLRLLKTVGIYIVIGAFIGAFIKEAVPTTVFEFFSTQSQWWVIPVAAILGVPLYVRLSTMLPVAQALMVNGFPLAPIMALIIGGAGASLPEILMLNSIFKRRLIFAFIISIFSMATFAGYLFLIIV